MKIFPRTPDLVKVAGLRCFAPEKKGFAALFRGTHSDRGRADVHFAAESIFFFRPAHTKLRKKILLPCYRRYWDCGGNYATCAGESKILFSWSPKVEKLHFPSGVGFPLGDAVKINFLVLQVHYNAALLTPDYRSVSNAGMQSYYILNFIFL